MLSNTYDMLGLLRDNIGEKITAQWEDYQLLRKLNASYRSVLRSVSKSMGQWLVVSTSITAVNSVLTLPSDCAKPIYLEDEDGYPVNWLNSVAQRSLDRGQISEVYSLRNTLEINTSGNNKTFTLWYQLRAPELHAGQCFAGGTGTITLEGDKYSRVQDDYYNNYEIDIISGSYPGRYTITDFVGSTRVASLNSTDTFDLELYGIVPVIPEECINLVVLEATYYALLKPSSIVDDKLKDHYFNLLKMEKKSVDDWLAERVIENTGVSIREY